MNSGSKKGKDGFQGERKGRSQEGRSEGGGNKVHRKSRNPTKKSLPTKLYIPRSTFSLRGAGEQTTVRVGPTGHRNPPPPLDHRLRRT